MLAIQTNLNDSAEIFAIAVVAASIMLGVTPATAVIAPT